MHFDDLTLCRYHSGPFDPDNWCVPLLAIGWLEHPHEFAKGAVSNGLVSILHEMAVRARALYSHYYFRGVNRCSVCVAAGSVSPGPIWSQENLFVPGRNVVYLSPGGVCHYVDVHSYRPPQEYVDAVLSCPAYGSGAYCDALRTANSGQSVPLLTQEEDRRRFEALLRRPAT
jgi:hypothetical protein